MSIPSRVLISSNISHMTLRTEVTQCQSLQGFSYHLTLYKIDNDTWFKVSIPSRVLISSNMLINLLNDKKKSTVSIPSRVLISSNNCINLFSADLISVSIPSRVLISSNTVLAIPLFIYAHISLCGADSFFTVSSHHYIYQNAFQPSIHAMRG